MHVRLGLAALGFALVFPISERAVAAITSDFTSGADGWDVISTDAYNVGTTLGVNVTAPATHVPSGGSPGGYITAFDLDHDDTMFRAPSSFLGDLSAYLDGVLSYARLNPTTALDYNGVDVVLKGNGVVLTYNAPIPTTNGVWEAQSVTLAPGAGWLLGSYNSGIAATLSDFQTALADVTVLAIGAAFTVGVLETTGLDSFRLSTGSAGTSQHDAVAFGHRDRGSLPPAPLTNGVEGFM